MAGRGREMTLPAWKTNENLALELASSGNSVSSSVSTAMPLPPSNTKSTNVLAAVSAAAPASTGPSNEQPNAATKTIPILQPGIIPSVGVVPPLIPAAFNPLAASAGGMLLPAPGGGFLMMLPGGVMVPVPMGAAAMGAAAAAAAAAAGKQPLGGGLGLGIPAAAAMGGTGLAATPAAAAVRVGDPTNDAACWSEHTPVLGPAGGCTNRYWYNMVTGISTYDKPLCLKTPEERAVANCPWKEYLSAEGKLYYSNGTDSRYAVPSCEVQWLFF
jgi:hypothetical protein